MCDQLESIFSGCDPLLPDKSAAPIVGATPSSLKQSRYTGTLFGKTAPSYLKMGRSTRYKLSALLRFREQFHEYRNTTDMNERTHQFDESKEPLSDGSRL